MMFIGRLRGGSVEMIEMEEYVNELAINIKMACMEELVERLAELRDERKANEDAANSNLAVAAYDEEINRIETRLADMMQKRNDVLLPYGERQAEIDTQIAELQTQIIDAWDSEKKTLKFNAGTLFADYEEIECKRNVIKGDA